VIVLEVRGPVDQVTGLLKSADGVAKVTAEPAGDGVTCYEVRTHQSRDLREDLCQRLVRQNLPVRRLDLRRRRLQDRWNEINNTDETQLRSDAETGSTAVA
jgi:hypothetical protein